jgi:hypothetical protein
MHHFVVQYDTRLGVHDLRTEEKVDSRREGHGAAVVIDHAQMCSPVIL